MKQLSSKPIVEQTADLNGLQEVQKAREAITKLKPNMAQAPAARCPVAHKLSPIADEMEKDFTTQGKPSSLECPFAEMSKNGPLDTGSKRDPIAAEFHQDSLSAQLLEEARACGRCPIRFLDKHSPEEIAQYFENHKHEIPRSHEVCVKRYGQNESSIRQLDAKYGNIVNMIQGLGNKHRPFLSTEQQGAESTDGRSGAAVQNWANQVSDQTSEHEAEAEDEQRTSQFDKSLRAIRVGESPTRPWGISVPPDRPLAGSRMASDQESPTQASRPKAEIKVKDVADVLPDTTPTRVEGSARPTRSHASTRQSRYRPSTINFNGPVFLGYSAEQAAIFLQQLGASTGNVL